ncbi:MAG: hypothetical protein Q8R39_01275 [bacterium]|nr:hypothetical protein [bacterium]
MKKGAVVLTILLAFVGSFFGAVVTVYLLLPVPQFLGGNVGGARTLTASAIVTRGVAKMLVEEDSAAKAALAVAERSRQDEQRALAEQAELRHNAEEHRNAVASAKEALARARGMDGESSDAAWISSVRRGPKNAYEQTCDAYERYRAATWVEYALSATHAVSLVKPDEIGLDSLEQFRELYAALAKKTIGGLLVSLKNRPSSETSCGRGESSVDLRNGPEVFETILYILKTIEMSPEQTELTTQEEFRNLLRGSVRIQVEELRPLLKSESSDARAILAGYLEEYHFSPAEVGLTGDEAALLFFSNEKK